MAHEFYDVALSGYGPTGLAAAFLLARRGHRVCVFERWPSLYGLPRMATIDGESARIIQAASDIDAALRHSVPRRRYVFANEKGDILIDHDWDKPHVCGFPFRISLHQPDIEDAMDAAARERGAHINQSWAACCLVACIVSVPIRQYGERPRGTLAATKERARILAAPGRGRYAGARQHFVLLLGRDLVNSIQSLSSSLLSGPGVGRILHHHSVREPSWQGSRRKTSFPSLGRARA